MSDKAQIRQPKLVTCNEREYVLVTPYRELPSQVGESRSEGPFYDSVPPNPKFVFMPDIRFVIGQTEEPSSMHWIER